MKEYICKEDLLNKLENEVGISERYSTTFVKDIATIKIMPTVTKAEIINDFVNAFIEANDNDYKTICITCDREDTECCTKCFRDRYLAEME